MENCYHQVQYQYAGEKNNLPFVKELWKLYAQFAGASRTKHWNSEFSVNADNDIENPSWKVVIDTRYFGHKTDDDYQMILNAFPSNYSAMLTHSLDKYWCDIGPHQNSTPECIYVDDLRVRRIIDNFYMFNIDQAQAESDEFTDDIFSLWSPLCHKDGKHLNVDVQFSQILFRRKLFWLF